MAITVNDKTIETTPTGFLVNAGDWDEAVAQAIAAEEDVELTERHWDLIHYLRDEFFNNGENQPNTRHIVKTMQEKWNDKSVSAKTLYELFPKDPSKQAGRIGGLPESRRKGGY